MSISQKKINKKCIIIITIVVFVMMCCMYILRTRYIFLGQQIYKKDALSIKVDCREKDYLLKKTSQFTQLETLHIDNYIQDQDDYIKFISSNRKLKCLQITCSSIGDASFMNPMSGLEVVHLFETDIDFSSIASKNVSKMELISCNIENLDMLKNCSSLKQLELYKGSYEGIQKNKDSYVLKDSAIFSELDSIVELDIQDLKIEDIKGFLMMDSLMKIHVNKDNMTQGQMDELESAGIQILC